MLEFKPYDFQEEDLPFFLANPKSGIWYEPRLGKTPTTVKTVADSGVKSCLIICTKNAVNTWELHFNNLYSQFCPNKVVNVVSLVSKYPSPTERQQKWATPKTADLTVFITTPASFVRDAPYLLQLRYTFEAIICDEYQRYLKGRKTKSFEYVKKFAKFAKRFHPLSGTPSDMGPEEFFTVLHMCNPGAFSSYWKYVNDNCIVTEGQWGTEYHGPKDPKQFQALLAKYGRVRLRDECAPHMPKVIRNLKPVEMSAAQAKMYNALTQDKFVWSEDKLTVAATSMEMLLRQRQILCCPAILDPKAGVGGAMEDLVEGLLETEQESEKHVVIFSPFRDALNVWEPYLRQNGFKNVIQLYGGLDPTEQAARIEHFKQTRGICICTVQYAQSFSLCPATNSYFIGYDWLPSINKQAEDRLVPQQGNFAINAWYYSYRGTIDDDLVEAIGIRGETIKLTVGRGIQN